MIETETSNLKYAYKLEEQMLAVAEAQEQGKLSEDQVRYRGHREEIEYGVRWIVFYLTELKMSWYDCNHDLLLNLKGGEHLTQIFVRGKRPDISFGRFNELVLAAVLDSQNQPLYKSPMFDLDRYLLENDC